MVKTVILQLTTHVDDVERYFPDKLQAKFEKSQQKVKSAETELDALLDDGYSVIAQNIIQDGTGTHMALLLHKRETR